MELNGAVPAGLGERHGHGSRAVFDVTVPNVARIYDYLLGGKDNFTADREAAEQLRAVLPDVAVACRQNREFLRRTVRYLAAGKGVSQFIDIGSGLPTASNTHQIAQAARPGARVAYIDHDPVVAGHSRVLLGQSPDVAVIEADLRHPGLIINHPAVRDLIDLSRPVAVLLVAVLHFLRDSDGPHGIVARLRSAVAPGSYLVISHVTADSVSREEYHGGISVYEKASAPVIPRRYEQVLRFFDGTDLVPPGLVGISQWRRSGQPERQLAYGAVGCITKAGVSDTEILTWSRDRSARLQIAARLARQIRDGRYADWRPLPSGTDLADEYDVSLSTVSRAHRLLADRGLIRRAGNSYYAADSPADGQAPARGLTTGNKPPARRDRHQRRRAGGGR